MLGVLFLVYEVKYGQLKWPPLSSTHVRSFPSMKTKENFPVTTSFNPPGYVDVIRKILRTFVGEFVVNLCDNK